jgi:hypothetical protein
MLRVHWGGTVGFHSGEERFMCSRNYEMDEERLIELVREHPAIYIINHPDHSDHRKIAKMWSSISMAHGNWDVRIVESCVTKKIRILYSLKLNAGCSQQKLLTSSPLILCSA